MPNLALPFKDGESVWMPCEMYLIERHIKISIIWKWRRSDWYYVDMNFYADWLENYLELSEKIYQTNSWLRRGHKDYKNSLFGKKLMKPHFNASQLLLKVSRVTNCLRKRRIF